MIGLGHSEVGREAARTVCRVSFEYLDSTGGSVNHTRELGRAMQPFVQQWLIGRTVRVVSDHHDSAEPFTIIPVYCPQSLFLDRVKRCVPGLPVAPLLHMAFVFRSLKAVRRLHRSHHIDILHGHGVVAGVVCSIAGSMLGIPAVWMMHGTSRAYSVASGIYEAILVLLFRPDHMLVLDDGSSAPVRFKRFMPAQRVTVVSHAIDTSRFCVASRDESLVRDLGVEHAFVAMCVQSLTRLKGTEFAIDAFARFTRDFGGEARLFVIGDGPERERLQALAKNLGCSSLVTFWGNVSYDEIPRYLSIADVVLETSLYSNVNRSAQEAMACGKAVVAFASGEHRSLFRNGANAHLVPAGDITALSDALRLLASDARLRSVLGTGARRTIETERSWSHRIRVELAVYQRIMSLRTRGRLWRLSRFWWAA